MSVALHELRFAAAPLTHLVRADGRGLCGHRLDPADVYDSVDAGRAIWELFPGARCRHCASALERLLFSVVGSRPGESEEQP